MTVSVYSLIISIVFYNISLLAVFILRRRRPFLKRYTTSLLMLLTGLGIVRLFTPLDFRGAYVLRSYRLLPAAERALSTPLAGWLTLGRLLLLLWAAGALFCLGRDVLTQARFRRADRLLPLVENEQIARIAGEFGGGFRLKISPEIELPFVTGLFRPTIYVPDIPLRDEEWRNVFLHETQHIRARDEWKKLVFRLIRGVFWWNPLAHISESEINTLIELQCDARSVGKGNLEAQEEYLRTMLTLMKRHASCKLPVGASRMVGGQAEMRLRFEALQTPGAARRTRLRNALSAGLLVLFLLSYTVIIQPAYLPPDMDIMSYETGKALDITENLNDFGDMYIVFEDGEYKLYSDGQYVIHLAEDAFSFSQWEGVPIIGGD